MKLTKSKLHQIIKEELAEITEPSYKFAPKATPEGGLKIDLKHAIARADSRERDRDMAYEGIREFLDSDGGDKAKHRLYGYLPESAELDLD